MSLQRNIATGYDFFNGLLDFDVVGHYARPDVFKLTIDERPSRSVTHEAD